MIYKQPTSLLLIHLMAMSRIAATNKLVSIAIDKVDYVSKFKEEFKCSVKRIIFPFNFNSHNF